MKWIRPFFLVFVLFFAVSWLSQTKWWKKTRALHFTQAAPLDPASSKTEEKLSIKAGAARSFVKTRKYNDEICFLSDMSLPSGKDRLFIYDLKQDSILHAGLVAHGNCYEYWLDGRKYSNVPGSGCTSLGKYRVGNSYTGKWGYSYKLHGLDSTNNNAFLRTVVLHSHSCVPDKPVTNDICQSNGCPTVSPAFLEKMKKIINNSAKPVLLWIYE